MAQIDSALEYFNDLGRGAKFSPVKFEDALNCLQVCAIRKGFPDGVLNELVTLWLKIKIPVTKWSALGYCMIPEGKASDKTVLAVVHWILSNHFLEDNSFKVVSALNWLIGLHELNLMNVDVLEPYYDFFFFYMNNNKFLLSASKFVYSYTKSRDVTRNKVLSILNLIETKKPNQFNCLLVLLSLFKSYRPECVPEDVPMISTNVAFSKPNKLLMERLEGAQIRSNVQLNLTSENRLTWWTGESATKNFRNQNIIHLLPDVDYLQLGSVIYMKDGETKKCLDFTSTHDLLVYHCGNRIKTPANILSLLVNDAGLHILQFSDSESQTRLSQTLYHTLYNNFLKTTKANLNLVEKTHFLKRISALEARLQQGIPVVSRFLSQFISTWNGIDYLNEILELLEWITFDSFDELYDLVLEHIETLFLTNDVLYRCTLLDMLKKMYINIHKMMSPERKFMFLSLPRINDVEILTNFSDYINELCEKSLNTLPDSIALKHCFLDIYEIIADLELQCEKPIWSVMPMCLAYGILCSYNPFSINRILGLFLKYREIYNKIKQNYGKETIKYQITLAESYSTDYVNCLWYGCAISWGHQGLMMNKLPQKLKEQMGSHLAQYDRLLDIKHHIAFAPFMTEDMEDIDEEFWLKTVIAPTFENIPKFIETVVFKS